MITRKNDSSNKPVSTAPRILVATNSIARRTTAKSTVAIIAPKITVIALLRQQGLCTSQHFVKDAVRSNTARYTTAMPKRVHKNAGVTVIAAVILRKAAMIPTAILTITAIVVHELLQEQSDVDIKFTSFFISICQNKSSVKADTQ